MLSHWLGSKEGSARIWALMVSGSFPDHREAAAETVTTPRSVIQDRACFRVAFGLGTFQDAAKPATSSLCQEPEHMLLLAAAQDNRPWG